MKYQKVKLDEGRMACAPVDVVDKIPWDVDGDHIYKIKCTEEEWISKYEDGPWFLLRESSCISLKGKHKFGKCQGSYICK